MMGRIGDERRPEPSGPPGGESGEGHVKDARLSHAVSRGMILGAGVTIVLVIYGVLRFPSVLAAARTNPLDVCAGIGIAILYAIIGRFGPVTPGLRDVLTMRWGVQFGLGGGVVFAVSMLVERLLPHDERQNAMIGLATFGLIFFLLIAAGFSASLTTRRVRTGPPAALWAALIASQLWFILLLAMYYAFIGTEQEARFLEVDQILADFRRSGEHDLRVFVFGDFMGGGFFHSLLLPLLSLPLGLLGGAVAKAVVLIGGQSAGHDQTAGPHRVEDFEESAADEISDIDRGDRGNGQT